MPPSDAEKDIVIVEDDETDTALIRRVLRRLDLEDTASFLGDGQALLVRLGLGGEDGASEGTRLPRLVVLDLMLPRVNGLDVLRAVDGARRLRAVPLVVLSSSSDPRDIAAAYGAGANSYVVKPVGSEEFNRKLETLFTYWYLDNEVYFSGD